VNYVIVSFSHQLGYTIDMALDTSDVRSCHGTLLHFSVPKPMKIAETILSALAEPVLVLDGTLRAVMANPALYNILSIVPGQLVGKLIQELIAEENGNPRLGTIFNAVLAHNCNVDGVEIICAIPPDTRKIFSVSARRVTVEESSVELVLVELRDVTHEKETEQRVQILNEALERHAVELEEINNELESFTHSASHDLRTPLRLTNKIAHLMLHDHGSELSAGATEKLHMILNSTHEMGKLIEDLLSFSQVTREPMKKRRVDVRRLAREALDELLDQYRGRDVQIVIDELPPCQADRALLKQVILNLLANALKFTRPREHAEIHVGFRQFHGEVVYFVQDNGIGFDTRHAESIFVAFHRLHRARGIEGFGVGLALVKRIIERHGGRIWADAKIDGGATFYFTLGEQPASTGTSQTCL
jgi:signal transduction histidine kinase